ncbi:MAG: hypothetical protein Q4A54_05545 [Parabacteroides sp.]|nr:hypothetical protein [Parabacteroides sp.]
MKEKDNWIFHNTKLLLEHYRDVVWSLEVAVFQTNTNFRAEFGTSLEDFLDLSYLAGLDIQESDVSSRIRSMNKSRNILRIIDSAVAMLREKHKNGEIYYWVLYYTYLSPQELGNVEEIIEKLKPYIKDCVDRTYYRKKKEAIQQLGVLLWGYTANDYTELKKELMESLKDQKQKCQ